MKKLVLVVAFATLVVGGLTSCRKCTTCTAYRPGDPAYTGPETCGSQQYIDDYEASFKLIYGAAAGYSVTCN